MNTQRLGLGLTAINLVLLAILLGREVPPAVAAAAPQGASPASQEVAPVLRGRALELVDERGKIRSRIDIYPEGDVVLRLLDRNGTIRVKLGAGESGAGLVLLDEATEPAVHLLARQKGTAARPATTNVTLRGADGRQRVIKP